MIHLEDVSKIYDNVEGGLTVLDRINLHIRAKEFVSIIGKSGSGKSSLLYILGLLDQKNTGSIRFLGKETRTMKESELAYLRGSCIGFVFQSFMLIPHLSILENVKLPLFYKKTPMKERHQIALDCLDRVHMSHRLDHLPNQISGGECQRVAIARALISNPALILADEPTGNLDTKTGERIFSLFDELHQAGHTIVLITHEPAIADRIPRTITISDGRVVEDSHP